MGTFEQSWIQILGGVFITELIHWCPLHLSSQQSMVAMLNFHTLQEQKKFHEGMNHTSNCHLQLSPYMAPLANWCIEA